MKWDRESIHRLIERYFSRTISDLIVVNQIPAPTFAEKKALEWSAHEEEFVKRAGFALIAVIAWQRKDEPNASFGKYFPVIERESVDTHNYVKKAVNWALRQIGKRNKVLNRAAIASARRIAKLDSKAAKWCARDALRELEGDKVQDRLNR